MNPDRWQRIEELCHAAEARDAAQRAAFLDEACGDDAELRREVESLLAARSGAEGFLETPAVERGALQSGRRLDHYVIEALIGEGGMGRVYRARDTKLGRQVAVKVLPPSVAHDPKRRQRLEREARAIAALSHPHICVLHDVGSDGDVDFLVMELLEGKTLAERLTKGALPVSEALTRATEIAGALAAAHRAGIVHRDLKPGNVMLTKTGAKLLDFGLAKLRPTPPSGESATLSASATDEGVILGTLQYMAPEQLEGQAVDARTDIFAFGMVLYEMLTGQRAFTGASRASLIGAILRDDVPALATRQPLVPSSLEHIVHRCLQKDPDARWQSADDLAAELGWIRDESSASSASGVREAASAEVTQGRGLQVASRLGWLAAGVAAAGVAVWVLGARPGPPRSELLSIEPAESLSGGGYYEGLVEGRPSRTALAWSPGGERLVFVGMRDGVQQLFVSGRDGLPARPLEGTEGAESPFFSPDGAWVGFWSDGVGGTSTRDSLARRALRKVPIDGGPVQEIVETVRVAGVSWGANDTIVFNSRPQDPTLWAVNADGGDRWPVPVPPGDSDRIGRELPHFLPDGHRLLYTRRGGGEDPRVAVLSLETGESSDVILNATDGRYVPTGHVVFMRQGTLMAVPFDLRDARVTGAEVALLDDVMHARRMNNSELGTSAGQFAFSDTGDLAYIAGGVFPLNHRQPAWFDRDGRVDHLPLAPAHFGFFRISPDGGHFVVNRDRGRGREKVIFDVGLDRESTALLVDGCGWIVWDPDSRHVAFTTNECPQGRVYSFRTDGSDQEDPALLTSAVSDPSLWIAQWGPRGELLWLRAREPVSRGFDVMAWWPDTGESTVVYEDQGYLRYPALSPDGRWLAYSSNVNGRNEVFVRPYPTMDGRITVSVNGGESLRWTRNGRELLYLEPGNPKRRLMAVDMSALFDVGGRLPDTVGEPVHLFDVEFGWAEPLTGWDVTADGERVLAYVPILRPDVMPPPHIRTVTNWFADLKAKVRAGQ